MSDVGVGDVEVPYLDITPVDGTTAATLTVVDPAGAETVITATGGTVQDDVQRWTADTAVTYAQAGLWLLKWTVTGTGAGAETLQVYVTASPVSGGPTWLPGRSAVARYIPNRTLARNPATYQASGDTYTGTFDATTSPTGSQVDGLIRDGAAWVLGATGSVDSSLHDLAAACAALWAAAAVERAWPKDDTSLQRARDLLASAKELRAELAEANDAVAVDTSDADFGLMVAAAPRAWPCSSHLP